MNLQLRRPYSFAKQLLFLAAMFAGVQSGYAAPHFQQEVQQPQAQQLQSQVKPGSTSFTNLQSQAERGDAVAQYNLALAYLHNNPTYGSANGLINEDYQAAVKWVRASAAQGNADAEFLLGYLYEHSQGVPRDYTKAAENYRAAAMHGNSSAENNLASLYQHGQGVPKNMGKAFEWYLASARHGNPVGQCNLATLYYLGAGIPQDYKEAARWFRAAADSGSGEAQNSLAVLYYKGLGVELDYGEAARWLRRAAEQGLPGAETNLAYLYEQGSGVPLNYVAAYTWYSRAVAAGDGSGAERRRQISRLMTRKQVDEASSLLTAVSSQPQKQPPAGAGTFSLLESH